MSLRVKEIEAKSLLTPSKLPDADFVVNPYTGCEFGCGYCYASFMGRWHGESVEAWGEYLYVKANAVEVFRRDLKALKPDRRTSSILLSSVTDPYQGAESRYRLTRGVLEILAEAHYPGCVSILTKSPLVLRDVEILQSLPNAEVGLTVTTTDDVIGRWLEVRAPLASRRLQTLRELNDAGIRTYAFVGPLLPHYRSRPDLLEALFSGLHEAGVQNIYVEHMNLRPYIRQRLDEFLEEQDTSVQNAYLEARGEEHRAVLDELVASLVDRFGMRLRLAKVLDHGRDAAAASKADTR